MRACILIVLSIVCGTFSFADAAMMTYVSDLISDSAPNASVRHTVSFTLASSVPPSGKIVVVPEGGAYVIPAGFDFQDVDLAVSTSGVYTNRTLAATASAVNDGVSVVTGAAGSITITLNSTVGLNAGESVRLTLGTHASFGGAGNTNIVNPSDVQSYRIRIYTRNASDTQIDFGYAMIAIVEPVTNAAFVETAPPVRFNGLPSGTIAHNNAIIEITFETNEYATCRYATTTDVLYADMTGTFNSVSGFFHYIIQGGHQNNTSYAYYVRCADFYDTQNDDDYAISFTLEPTPTLNTSGAGGSGVVESPFPPNGYPPPATTGMIGPGGSDGFPSGEVNLYRSNMRLTGWAAPQSSVTVLKDGVQAATASAGANGAFSVEVGGLERGTHSFSTFMTDSAGRKSASYASTITVTQGSNNTMSDIIVPPTMELSAPSVSLNGDVRIFGESVPGSAVEVTVTPQTGGALGDSKKYSAEVSLGSEGVRDGVWEVTFNAGELRRGTYHVRARTIQTDRRESRYSDVEFLGIGEEPSPDFGARADINGDGKVNLVDFSIMLSFWGTGDAGADINADGTINLADFSILLFNWTG